jgi:GT2 family glycosyltransferase
MAARNPPSHVLRRGLRAVRALVAPAGPSAEDRWRAYLKAVEPVLAAVPRVHRFARVPTVAEAGAPAEPLAVWIEGDGERAAVTRAGLAAWPGAAPDVLEGPLTDALARCRADRVLLIRAGDVLAPLALERFGQAAALAPDADLITCDEDDVDAAGVRHGPRFAPCPSPDRWLACDASGSTLLVARAAAEAALPWLTGGAAWRHELALVLAGRGAGRAAHVPALLSHRGPGTAEPPPLSPEATAGVLRRWEPGARVELAGPGLRRIRRAAGGEPSIEVIVCLRDRPELLRRCVDSLLATTAYDRLAVALVDNGSREPATHELLTRYDRDSRVRVLHDPRPFNFAALNNAAARSSAADVLVFLNNDTEVVDGAWASTLLEEAIRPEVGAVAPLLQYPDGKVQHAGAALGLHGYAGHPFAGLTPGQPTPFGRADGGVRNWLAVSAACMMVQRTKFEAVGGFDESFVVAGNDVDLCLRLTAAGRRSLCTPHTHLVHDESRSRGGYIDPADFVRSERSYGEFRTVGDPFYNPNLTLEATDCGVRTPGGPSR